MATQTTGGGSTTSFTNTPQAKDDCYYYTEDQLLALLGAGQIVTLDVMSNDLGGNAKSLFAIDDGNGNALAPDFDLLNKDAAAVWETTAAGNQIRIVNGKVEYKFNNNVNALDDGETFTDYFVYAIRLGNGTLSQARVKISVAGQDDPPTLAPVTAGSIAEDAQLATTTSAGLSGNLVGADVDGDTLTYGISGVTPVGTTATLVTAYGTLVLDTATGAYAFTPDAAAIEALDEDDAAVVLNFTFTVNDGDGPDVSQPYSITITGADDPPTLAPVTAGSIDEDDQLGTTTSAGLGGNLVGADVDGDSLTYGLTGSSASGVNQVSLVTAYGTLTLDTATGAYTFTPDAAAIEALDSDDAPVVLNFTFTVNDGDDADVSQPYQITITGADDPPTLAPVTAGSIAEDDQLATTTSASLSGNLVGADVDGDTLTYGINGVIPVGTTATMVTAYGTLVVDTATGAYTFTPDAAAIEALDSDDAPVVLNFTFTVNDGDGADVSQPYQITITGADDPPTLAAVAPGSVEEVANSTTTIDAGLSGNLVGADVDGETLTYGIVGGVASGVNLVSLAGTYGTLTVNTLTGAYSYAKNAAAIEALNAGQNPSDAFTVTVSDGDGPTVNQFYTVNITGANDYTSPTVFTGTGDQNDFDGLGLAGSQTINGGNGNQVIYGGSGNDNLNGNNGDDTIYGGSGDDSLNGNADVDNLYGGSGNDIIQGSGQNDLIVGGYGADILTGGGGNDTFKYLSNLDTGDTISDFTQGGDKIDLTAFAPSAFIGALGAPGAVGPNQVGFINNGTTTTIYVDTDGIAGADLEITLTGGINLVASDFFF